MHVTYSDKSLVLGDEIAALLVEYAAALGRDGSADSVTVHAIGADGGEVEATFLLNGGIALMAETTNTTVPEPDNDHVVAEVREKLAALTRTYEVAAAEVDVDVDVADHADWDDFAERS